MVDLFQIVGDEIRYTLHPAQGIVLNIFYGNQPKVFKNRIKEVLLSAGTGGGKTSFGILLIYLLAQKLRGQRDGIIDFLVLAPDYKRLQGIIIDKFVDVFAGRLQMGKYVGQPQYRFSFTGALEGVNVYFRNASDPHSIEGIHADFVWADEIGFHSTQVKVPKKTYQVMKDRIRQKDGYLFMTTTPYIHNWVYRDFVIPSNKIIYTVEDEVLRQAIEQKNPELLRKYLKKQVVVTDSEKLTIIFPSFLNPTYPVENFFTAKEDWDIEGFKMRFFGLWTEQKPAVLHGFREKENVIEPFIIPAEESDKWQAYLGIDFGVDQPFACVFLAKSPDGVFYVMGEYVQAGYDNSVHARQIKLVHQKLVERFNYPVDITGVYADPSGSARSIENQQNVASLIKELAKYYGGELSFKVPISRVYYGISVLNQLLSAKKLQIFNTCDETISEVYEWETISGTHERDHCWDAIRYVVATLCYFDKSILGNVSVNDGDDVKFNKQSDIKGDAFYYKTLNEWFKKIRSNNEGVSIF